VIGVVAPVGCDVGEASPEETGNDQGGGELAEGRDVELGACESSSCVEKADVGRERETEAVGVKDEGTEVERSGYARHG